MANDRLSRTKSGRSARPLAGRGPWADAAIRAAGAVVWRPGDRDQVEIALVHRPRYDDWSLPKGKADPGESPALTAWREVAEETGFRTVVGRALTSVSYEVAGKPKTVQYFAARSVSGTFVPNKEVDQLLWLNPREAAARMTYEYDQAVLATFSVLPAELSGVVVVRHARAGHRESFDGDDQDRPLDGKGRRQAVALADQLPPFQPLLVGSAPLERCTATVTPTADRLSLRVLAEPALSEEAYRDEPAAARRRIVELAELVAKRQADGDVGAAMVCSQGGVIPGVVKSLAARHSVQIGPVSTPKASYWYLSFDGRELVQADHHTAPELDG
ncbi:NUDIX hydrolase [Nakamurella leprariae]|uniref:NUDIX hydrolase n=1 Tax=Nakamurella leprariae TaxID=2803911 RepID=UPI002E2B66A5|nr:NUDIX hydrolase [Nakamurella leprariae]